MLTAVVTQTGATFSIHLIGSAPPDTSGEETTEAESHGDDLVETDDGLVAKEGVAHAPVELAAPGPNPIVPELKEVVWGASAFIVLALVMRYVAFPKLRKGMDARYAHIRDEHESADAARETAQAEVAEYQGQLAAVKAEAAKEIDAARQLLEVERAQRLAAVNEEIAVQRSAAQAEADAARAAVQDQVAAAVVDVAGSAAKLAIGKDADPAVVTRVVNETLSAGASR